jgi:hypothetical protein
MKNRSFTYGVSVAAVLVLSLLVSVSASIAQQANAAKVSAAAAKSTPKMTDGHPDFSGFWLGGVAGINYANDEGASEDGNLTRTADGSIIFTLRWRGTRNSDGSPGRRCDSRQRPAL